MTTAALTLADLRTIDLFDGVSDAELEPWLEAAKPSDAQAGDVLIEQGVVPDLLLLLEGDAQSVLLSTGGRQEPLSRHLGPTWIGAIAAITEAPLPLRMQAVTPCRLARVPTERFGDLARTTPAVHRRVMRQVGPVTTRITAREQTRERLASLGTMAAGLAHELNNPAAAAKRAASELVDALDIVNGTLEAFVESGIEREEAQQLVTLQRQALERANNATHLQGLEAADAEDAMLDLLESAGIDDAWRVAEPLAAAGVDAAWLTEVRRLAGPATTQALRWVGASLSAHNLARELLDSADRMGTLVKAIKTYTYVDRGDLIEADLHDGLDSTLIIMGHKLKHTTIEVVRNYDRSIPKLTVRGSELNQVWTNIIDNAIDALGDSGTLTLTTSCDDRCAQVDITDDGPGMPPDVVANVLDPFFTTKPVGQGTGLGLDTARRIIEDGHGGSLAFETSDAGTTFHVRLPLSK